MVLEAAHPIATEETRRCRFSYRIPPARGSDPHPQARSLPEGSPLLFVRLADMVPMFRRAAMAQAEHHQVIDIRQDDARLDASRPDIHVLALHPPTQLSLPWSRA